MKYDKYIDGIHVITNLEKYLASFPKTRKRNTKLTYLEQKRADGLIDPPEVEIEDEPDATYEDIMARKFMYLVKESARSWGSPSMYDALFSAGLAGLTKGIRSWNQAKGQQNTYYNRCIKNAMINTMNKEATYQKYHVSLEGMAAGDLDEEGEPMGFLETHIVEEQPTPEEILIDKEETTRLWAIIFNVVGDLSYRQNYIVKNRILSDEPDSLRDIAEHFNCGKSTISREEKAILTLLRRHYEDSEA